MQFNTTVELEFRILAYFEFSILGCAPQDFSSLFCTVRNQIARSSPSKLSPRTSLKDCERPPARGRTRGREARRAGGGREEGGEVMPPLKLLLRLLLLLVLLELVFKSVADLSLVMTFSASVRRLLLSLLRSLSG